MSPLLINTPRSDLITPLAWTTTIVSWLICWSLSVIGASRFFVFYVNKIMTLSPSKPPNDFSHPKLLTKFKAPPLCSLPLSAVSLPTTAFLTVTPQPPWPWCCSSIRSARSHPRAFVLSLSPGELGSPPLDWFLHITSSLLPLHLRGAVLPDLLDLPYPPTLFSS